MMIFLIYAYYPKKIYNRQFVIYCSLILNNNVEFLKTQIQKIQIFNKSPSSSARKCSAPSSSTSITTGLSNKTYPWKSNPSLPFQASQPLNPPSPLTPYRAPPAPSSTPPPLLLLPPPKKKLPRLGHPKRNSIDLLNHRVYHLSPSTGRTLHFQFVGVCGCR